MSRKKRECKLVYLLLLLLTLNPPNCVRFNSEQTTHNSAEQLKKAEEEIAKYEVLKEPDALCKQISVPIGFQIVGKSLVKRAKSVHYKYYSPSFQGEISFKDLRRFYVEHLQIENGWRLVDERDLLSKWVEFEKDGYKVNIGWIPTGVNYKKTFSVSCKKITE